MSKNSSSEKTTSSKSSRKGVRWNDVKAKIERHPSDIMTFARGKPISIPKKLTWVPKYTEWSHQFNDFNDQYRKVRGHPQRNKMRQPSRDGAQAQGRYHHDKETHHLIKNIKYRQSHKEIEIPDINIEMETQRDQTGAEIRGFVKLNMNKAKADVKQLVKKVNRGRNHHSGYWAHGNRYKQFIKETQRYDNKFKSIEAEPDEFKSLAAQKKTEMNDKNEKYVKDDGFGL